MREKVVESYLKRKIEAKPLFGKCYKWVATAYRGMPDRICCLPDAEIWFVETKAPDKRPDPLQVIRHQELKRLGFNVIVLDTFKKVDHFIETLCKKKFIAPINISDSQSGISLRSIRRAFSSIWD